MRFVLRLLDAEDRLLMWSEVWADPRPGGKFIVRGRGEWTYMQSGIITRISIQWPDLDVARVVPFPEGNFSWEDFPLWVVEGDPLAPLPPVEVNSPAGITVPVGGVGAR